jgi:DNA polymerase (family X)
MAPPGKAPAMAALEDDLAELAALLRAARVDRFRVRAYERAVRLARGSPVPLQALDPAELRQLAGVGDALARLVAEHAATGTMRLLEERRAAEPPGVGRLLTLPLVGLRDARRLATLGIDGPEALRAALADEAPASLDERLAARLREALRRVPAATDPRLPRPVAAREAAELAAGLAAELGPGTVHVAGALRRRADLVEHLDLVVVVTVEHLRAAIAAGCGVVRVLEERGPALDVLTAGGRRARLHTAAPQHLGAALAVATGPGAHVAVVSSRARERGLVLAADGLKPDGRARDGHRAADPATPTEEALYAALDLPWLDPELREDPTATSPRPLVRGGDLRGDLHVHSDFSGDGVDSVEEMVRGAAGRGYEYVALTDHAENLTINGMPREAVLARRRTIAEVQRRHPHVRVLDAAELNIDLDGSLDYDLDFLLGFDLCVASVHSHMDRGRAAQTERILAAIAHPAVTVIGHPTGRILGRRPGYAIDLAAIAEAAAETGTALEVNGSPVRLDLDGPMVRAARAAGARLSLASDAHSLGELGAVEHAVATARNGWAEVDDVLNARPLDELLTTVAAIRSR